MKIYWKVSRILKTLVILVLSIVAILSIIIVLTLSYKDDIVSEFKNYFESKINTEIRIKKIELNFIKKFPSISVSLKDVCIKSNSEFLFNNSYYDTLIFAKNIIVELSLKNLIRNEVTPSKIHFYNSIFNIIVDKRGSKNYEIFSKTNVTEKSLKGFSSNIILKNSRINYINLSNNSKIVSYIDKVLLSFPEKNLNNIIIKAEGFLDNLDFDKNIQVKKEKFELYGNINNQNNLIAVKKTRLEINGIKLNIEGSIQNKNFNFILESQKIDYNLLVKTIRFKDFEFLNSYKNIRWNFYFKTRINIYKNENYPIVLKINAKCNRGIIKNAKNDQIDKVIFDSYIKLIFNKNKQQLEINVNNLNIEYGKNIVIGNVLINGRTIESDFKFSINLDQFVKFFDIDNFITNGELEGNINFLGDTKELKNLDLKSIRKANISFNNFFFKNIKQNQFILNNIDQITGDLMILNGNCEFNNLELSILKNNIILNGKLNYPELSKGEVYIKSNKIFLNEWPSIKIKSENNIIEKNLKLILNINDFSYKSFKTNNLNGKINIINDEINLKIDNLDVFSGEISLEMRVKSIEGGNIFSGKADLHKVNIKEIFKTFNNFTQKSLTYQNIEGTLTSDVLFTFFVKSDGKIDLNSINVNSYIEINNGRLINFPLMMSLSKYIDAEELKDVRFKTLKNNILIEKGKILIPEMDIISTAFKIKGSGYHTFDNSYEYNLIVDLNEFLSKKARKKNPDFENIYEEEDNKGNIRLPLKITGKDTTYQVTVDKNKLLKVNFGKKETFEENIKTESNVKNLNLDENKEEKIKNKIDKKSEAEKKSNIKFDWE